MNNNQKFVKILTSFCLTISGLFLFAGCYFLWKNRGYEMGNHSFLFGTPLEAFLAGNKISLSLSGSIPLVLPFFLKRSRLNAFFLLLAVALFIFLWHILSTISD